MTIPPPADITMIGKYQIIELAGEGAMGAVYRARDTVLNRMVAVKVMNATIARDKELRDRFLREAQSAGSLQHPNVVTIFDFGEVDGHLFIAMEFVEGSDFEHLLEAPEPLSLEAKLEIMIDALAGLGYAHQRGIVHRDLKPANIRVTSDMRAKLMDFGVAHLESSKMTKTGTMIGTPSYMAPEYISGLPVTTVSDVFSMGAVLYHALTGNKPFGGDSLHAVLFSVVQSDPPLPSSIVPSLPTALDGIVRRAMAKNPEDRYQSALEMAHALTSLLAQLKGVPANATQSLSTTLAHRVASRGAAAARDHASRTNASSANVAAASQSTPAIAQEGLTAPAKRSTRTTMLVGGVAAVVILGAAGVFLSNRQSASLSSADSSAVAPATSGVVAVAAATPPASDATTRSAAQLETRAGTGVPKPAMTAPASSGAPTAVNARPGATSTPGTATTDSSTRAQSPETKSSGGAGAPPAAATATPPVVVPQAATTTTQANVPVPPPAAPEAAPARNVPNELRDLIARYAQAISARDLGAIREVYPRITSEQARGFEQFFASTKGLLATLSLGSIDVADATAEGRVSGVYAFTSSSGRSEKQPVNFRARFERQGDKWRLASVQ